MLTLTFQHVASGRVENTRVNPDSLIDELLANTNLKQAVEDSAESEYCPLLYNYTPCTV